VEFDHAIYAVRDFEAAARRLWDDHGLAAVPGGRHAGWGTANWIVPLGSSYIELIGVENEEEASRSFLGQHLITVLGEGERFVGWVVAPDLFDEAVARAGLEVSEGSRVRPDGAMVRWRSAGVEVTMQDPSLPFFIEWLVPPELHPGQMEAAHRVQPFGISWVEVHGDESAVRSWLGDESLPVRVTPGAPALLAVGVDTDHGEVVLR
jgi:glyoxalase-like protein